MKEQYNMVHISSMGVLVNLLEMGLYYLTGSAALADSVFFLAAMAFSLRTWSRVLCCCAGSDPSAHHGHIMLMMLQL